MSLRRREFIAGLSGAAAWPLAARAQQRRTGPVIGILGSGRSEVYAARLAAFKQALKEAGWQVIRRRGSHEVWARPGEDARLVVAGKDSATVPVGTLSLAFEERAVWSICDERIRSHLRAS